MEQGWDLELKLHVGLAKGSFEKTESGALGKIDTNEHGWKLKKIMDSFDIWYSLF